MRLLNLIRTNWLACTVLTLAAITTPTRFIVFPVYIAPKSIGINPIPIDFATIHTGIAPFSIGISLIPM